MNGESFDYIVAGAGSAGCAMAARLSESGRYRVLLLEAGPKDTATVDPRADRLCQLFANPRLNWMFESEPEPELERPHDVPAARQGAGRHQLDQRHGLHARQSRRLRRMAAARLHRLGLGQHLAVFPEGRGPERAPTRSTAPAGRCACPTRRCVGNWATHCVAAAIEAGLPANTDFNNGEQEGAGHVPEHDDQPPPLEHRGGLSEAGAQPRQSGDPHQGARDPHRLRRGPRRRGSNTCAPKGSRRGAGARRDNRLRRRLRLAAAVAVVGARPGRACCSSSASR